MTELSGPRETGRVVLGVDGSVPARRAAAFAAREAWARRVPLRILTVVERLVPATPIVPEAILDTSWETGAGARAVLDEAAELAEQSTPGLAIETAVAWGPAVPALVRESASADLLVIGNRGRGSATGLMLGSVAIDLLARAHCPVGVVRGPSGRPVDPRGPVVVGLPGGAADEQILEVALQAAAARGVRVHAVRAWPPAMFLGPAQGAPLVYEQVHRVEGELAALDESLDPVRARHPQVTVIPHMAGRAPADAILALANDASIVVVGSRGRGALAGAVLGSISQDVVHRAQCPVLVVPTHRVAEHRQKFSARHAHRNEHDRLARI